MNVGKLGIKTFLPGYYAYTGSALGKGASSLPNRLARHLKTAKKKHWHIDFLLADENVSIEAMVVVSSKQKLECQVNQLIRNQMKAKIPVPEFGACDCNRRCGSHLLYFGNKDIMLKIWALFQRQFGRDSLLIDMKRIPTFQNFWNLQLNQLKQKREHIHVH
jgi:Uri superfamily endonuclease